MEKQQSSLSIHTLLWGIWGHISHRRRIQLGLLLVVMLASGVSELVSLGAVIPFLALLSDPERLWEKPLVQALASQVGLTHASQLLLWATLAFAATAVLAALIRLTNLYLNGRLAAEIGSDLSCEAYRRTLYQPYCVHVQRNSSAVVTGTTTQINLTVVALRSLLQSITSGIVAASLLSGLLLIDAPVALSAFVLFGGAYWVLGKTARRELSSNSKRIVESSTHQVKVLQEGLGAIRDVLLDGSQPTYLHAYRQVDRPQRQLQAKNVFLSGFPRFALEGLVMVAMALLGGSLVMQRGSGGAVIPLLGTMALGAQRLLPALQKLYSGWTILKGNNAAIKAVLDMLNQPLPPQVNFLEPLQLVQSIRFESIHFSYGQNQSQILHGLNLQIRRGERIGLIGSTGSGKSTMIDLLMGLLAPTTGKLFVDGVDLHDPEYPERLLAWRASIAHVPQSVYLSDSSIAENIAFGVPRQHIDMALVKQAADQAQISSFIESNPEGYQSFVGERGVRLSGGQRQRVGIARALYKKSHVLVLDEATSALDTCTERTVINSINSLSQTLTVIMIAHRLSTLESCDRVIRLEQGTISADGPPRLVLAAQA